jgi:hypothetical protein
MVCHCIRAFSDAVASLRFGAIEEHWVTEDGHPVAQDFLAATANKPSPVQSSQMKLSTYLHPDWSETHGINQTVYITSR